MEIIKKENPNTKKNLKKLNEKNLINIIELQQVLLEKELGHPVDFDEALRIIKSRLKEGDELYDSCKVMSVYVDNGSNASDSNNISEKSIVKQQIKIEFNAPTENKYIPKLNFGEDKLT